MDLPRTDAPDQPRMAADPGAFAAWAGPALLPMTRLARRAELASAGCALLTMRPSEVEIAPSTTSRRRNWWAIASAAAVVAALVIGLRPGRGHHSARRHAHA